ncbi:MAG: hypothetical protein ABI300_01310 [Rhodanobacter sp.]
MRRTLGILAVLATLALSGCAAQTRSDALTNTLKAYASTVRWGDFASAAQFVDPATRKAHPLSSLDMARYAQVRVTEYNDDAAPVPASDTEVRQTVRINLVNINTQSERTITDNQVWRYDAAGKHWWLSSGLPDITRE